MGGGIKSLQNINLDNGVGFRVKKYLIQKGNKKTKNSNKRTVIKCQRNQIT